MEFITSLLTPEDQDLLRFLSWPNGNLNEPLKEYRMVVHLFGATSSPSCANFALRKTAEDAKDQMAPAAVKAIMHNFYVDDCLLSVSDANQAVDLVRDLTTLCESGGFHLTKWMGNNRTVLASIPESERVKEVKDLDLEHDVLPDERVLGVNWCTDSEMFKVRINAKDTRGILSFVSAVYDPLGFLSPVILPAKMILQELCGRKVSWDEDIPADLALKSQRWILDLPKLHGFTVDRCLKPAGFGKVTSAQMHHQKLQMPLEESVFWSDSTTVLRYIASENVRFKTFVANRVSLIRDNTKPSQWMYVNTELNPANHSSRGMNADTFIKCQDWAGGPYFLKKDEKHWPVSPHIKEIQKDDAEVKAAVSVNATNAYENTLKLICHYSEWHRLTRAVPG